MVKKIDNKMYGHTQANFANVLMSELLTLVELNLISSDEMELLREKIDANDIERFDIYVGSIDHQMFKIQACSHYRDVHQEQRAKRTINTVIHEWSTNVKIGNLYNMPVKLGNCNASEFAYTVKLEEHRMVNDLGQVQGFGKKDKLVLSIYVPQDRVK